MPDIEKMISWFEARKGKVTYSMACRNGPNSYDCSSAVYYALMAGGFLPNSTYPGNTESLYRLEGILLHPINRNEARRGDIFVAGVKGGSGGAFGHTGVFTSSNTIIHCNGADDGISETPFAGRTGSPVYCYRLKIDTTTKTEIIEEKQEEQNMTEFAFAYNNAMFYVCGMDMKLLHNASEWEVLKSMYSQVQEKRTGEAKTILDVNWTGNKATFDAYCSICSYGEKEKAMNFITEGIEEIKKELAK